MPRQQGASSGPQLPTSEAKGRSDGSMGVSNGRILWLTHQCWGPPRVRAGSVAATPPLAGGPRRRGGSLLLSREKCTLNAFASGKEIVGNQWEKKKSQGHFGSCLSPKRPEKKKNSYNPRSWLLRGGTFSRAQTRRKEADGASHEGFSSSGARGHLPRGLAPT